MIERLQRIATFLERLRLLIAIIAGLSIVFVLLSLVENPWLADDELLIPSILGFCWAATLYSISMLFAVVPEKPKAEAGLRDRLSYKLRSAGLWVLALLIVTLTLSVVVLSFQLLRAWL